MCQICAAFRPFDDECSYSEFSGPETFVTEVEDAEASVSTPYTITASEGFSGALDFEGDRDWIAVELTEGETYEISLQGTGDADELRDPYLRLFSSTGQEVAQNDDFGGQLDSQITFVAQSTGTYYISAGAYADRGVGTYTVTMSAKGPIREFDTDEIAEQLTDGYWESTGRARRAFDVEAGEALTVDIRALEADAQQLAIWGLEAWTAATGLQFSYVDESFTGNAQITPRDTEENA